ncbi:VOC family protein [Paenibacillus sp. CF384]|uniref:VOC family protein n=1 Tax=Paenibacillus sp. CF384 TaxID=1884382 RepID=UPI000898C35A|nr:VOC family protein [Paenibacillus sp. CF384]SDW61203.1 PhnB protein [Paenibacillus sp. CF384]
MSVDAYLNFQGNTREVIEFYAEVFNTEITNLTTFGELPPNPEYPLPPGMENGIMHARMTVLGSNLMFSDTFPGMPFTMGNNISLAIVSDDADELRRIYAKLSEGGSNSMPLQETFWTKLYGVTTDKFGITWQFNQGL